MKKLSLKKWASIVAVGLMMATLFTGCSKGEIVMGTNAAFPPFEYIEGGKIVGFDAEIGQIIADELGKELVIEDMEFDTLTAAVNSGKIDFAAAAMTITEEKSKQVDFSNPYFKSKQVIIVNEGDTSIAGPDDLVNKKIGVQLGTTGDLFASDIEGAKVERFGKAAIATLDLANKKVDAVIVDEEPAKKIVANQAGLMIIEAPFIDEEYGIATKKGNTELVDQINKVLVKIQEDGTYDALYEKYFGKTE
ncbi:MAG: basic amino acid ABC transporter substrate-binding protein [Cellulosilyticaceae bacterium]